MTLGVAIVKVSWSIDAAVVEGVKAAAKGEQRSVSQMASMLLERQLGRRPVGADPASAREEKDITLGEGEPSGGQDLSTAGSGPAALAAPVGVAPVAPSPSPSVGSSAVAALGKRLEAKPGDCPNALRHRKGEFCKTCGEMQ